MANALWSVSSVGPRELYRTQLSGGIPPEQWAVSGMVKKSRAGARHTHASLKPQQKSRKRFYLIPKRLRLPRCVSTGPVVVRLAEREMNVNVSEREPFALRQIGEMI